MSVFSRPTANSDAVYLIHNGASTVFGGASDSAGTLSNAELTQIHTNEGGGDPAFESPFLYLVGMVDVTVKADQSSSGTPVPAP